MTNSLYGVVLYGASGFVGKTVQYFVQITRRSFVTLASGYLYSVDRKSKPERVVRSASDPPANELRAKG
jgi:hypothetical protein